MSTSRIGDHATSRGAQEQALLQEVGLDHGLQRRGILAERCRERLQADRSTVVMLQQQGEQSAIAGIESAIIHPVQAESLTDQRLIHGFAGTLNRGHVPDPAQKAVSDAWGAATAAGDAGTGPSGEVHPQQTGRAPHDRFEILLAIKLQALNQAEAIPQR